MIDVQVWKPRQAVYHKINKGLKGTQLFFLIECPLLTVSGFAAIIENDVAEEVFEAAVTDKWIAFDVKEDVAGGRLGKPSETSVNFRRPQLVDRRFLPASFSLDAGLLAHSLITVRRTSFGTPGQRYRDVR